MLGFVIAVAVVSVELASRGVLRWVLAPGSLWLVLAGSRAMVVMMVIEVPRTTVVVIAIGTAADGDEDGKHAWCLRSGR